MALPTPRPGAPPPHRPRRRRRGYAAVLLFVLGSIVVSCFGRPGQSRVTRLYERGVPVVARAVSVTTDDAGRTTGITVRFRPKDGGAPVTTTLPAAPRPPRAAEGPQLKVVYDSRDPSDAPSGAQLRRQAPDWNAMVVAGVALMAAGPVVAVSARRRPRA